jgi:putative intracellular protease/amidase
MSAFKWFCALMLCVFAQAAPARADAQPSVAILMFDGVQIIDFSGPYEVFGQAGYRVFTVSKDGKGVTSAMGLQVNVDYSFDKAPPADVVVVPGGDVHSAMSDGPTLAWLKRASLPAKQVMSVCTGSFILAGTGLLDGQSATTFHKQFDEMSRQFPKVTILRDRRWVDAGKFVTSAGLASGIDTALHVVGRLRGIDKAHNVAMHLEYEWSPEHGFVRGLMADQFLRIPEQPLKFPEGTNTEEIRSFGNDRYWEKEWQVESKLSPAEFIAVIRKLAEADRALTVLRLPDPTQLVWRYRAERGGQWQLSFKIADAKSAGRYRLLAKLIRLDSGRVGGKVSPELNRSP